MLNTKKQRKHTRKILSFSFSTVMFVCTIPVALQNWATECCYSNYSGHVVAPALSTCLNADSSPVVPKQKTNTSDGLYTHTQNK